MDKNQDIEILLIRFFQGSASSSEKKAVYDWVKKDHRNQYEFEKLQAFWRTDLEDNKLINHEDQKIKIWEQYLSEGAKRRKGSWDIRRTSYGVAASLVAILVLSIVFFNKHEEAIQPISLTKVHKSNPRGQKSQFQLPDGSKVWLNAESKLSYPEHFSDSGRFVTLEGEAFFDIVTDTSRPFVVKVEDLEVEVLGTEFNVHAFKGNDRSSVALLEGAVKVKNHKKGYEKELSLTPGKGLTYLKSLNAFHEFSKENDANTFDKATLWRNGELIFDGTDLSGFVNEISRWYGVSVEIKGVPDQNWNLKGTFKNEYLSNILDAVSYNKDFKYELDDKKLILMFN
ncbi:FecR domain-containing protein [Echinicola sp. CAU 1574]|uniref:FecR domain-containing protein n=1 Tax=Echinicola arenosa TaxID=2774144 RepID=A0ABR9AKY6_9BACT|nr:FecR family protein [Echinicola arenosa]MBD8488493.1 FecR domain-containing protein [Echinicola arenosa]